ncbi:hypothetical protein K7J14_06010 [Treponema zuelzerae]|uniref:Nitrogen regulatory protein P-II n=1 Tax=Teretinema zuelzerae TaxID=156 RepID=A0AAE3EGV2_9SPIR|nr:PG0541 family transporter-associated protein [Teretinema zuelzerae]MBN2810930.1 hypothetical protein [Spirochaetales bacterium]MCD1654256.1 hypothetical protein [Teretinema zuelzerae]HPO03156.1 hypothetical protein [Treponemataceae bacterium]
MKRIEIIFSQSLEEDVFASLAHIPEAARFSIIPGVRGKGYSVPKMGDAVWPGENTMMIIWCESDAAAAEIEKAVVSVREKYPDEGVACFMM